MRIANTRVLLDVVYAEYEKGASPESIARSYPSLEAVEVYEAIAYCLRHPDELKAYLERRDGEAAGVRDEIERKGLGITTDLKDRIEAARAKRAEPSR